MAASPKFAQDTAAANHVGRAVSGQSASDQLPFRQCVSLFVTGIAVVTCTDGDSVHGMTVNSFTSVSLEPPTVLISLKAGRTHGLISATGRYGISVLNNTQQAWSSHFCGRSNDGSRFGFSIRDRQPTLEQCLAWFECEVVEHKQVHDHTLFIAHVTACGSEQGTPLMYFASRYQDGAIGIRGSAG